MIGQIISHYRIVERLGGGGMGIVYKAQDTRLHRLVALKFLQDEVAREPQALSRFRREAQAASGLNHPNICTIYDIEQQGNQTFIAMEYLDGETLASIIARGPLSVKQLLSHTCQIANALDAAHNKNMVHRDIKPANVFVTNSGNVKVLDFGLAKVALAISSDLDTASLSLTKSGELLGTIPYMSPEQAQGLPLDFRTDIYSLGVLIYEMAVGHRPFEGRTHAEIIAAILRDKPRNVQEIRADLPMGLQHVIELCLAKASIDRYRSVRDLRDAIEGMSQLCKKQSEDSRPSAAVPQSIAVLPFANLSPDSENEFFTDGVTEEIINALAQIKDLRVAARTSCFSFKGKLVDLRMIGEKLNVRTVLEGSVRRSGERLRITAKLVDVSNGYHLWSERYDRDLQDIFQLQDELARCIAGRFEIASRPNSEPLAKAGTKNIDAYQSYVKGRALLYQRGPFIPKALDCFQQAVACDPRYACAWAGMADAYNLLAYYGFLRPEQSLTQAWQAGTKAVTLDPLLAEGHAALALASLWRWDWQTAEQEYLEALRLNPRYIQARSAYALFYLAWTTARFGDATAEAQKAVNSDPLSAYAKTVLALAHLAARNFTDGVSCAREAVGLDPDAFLSHYILHTALGLAGHIDESIAVAEYALATSGRHPWVVSALAFAYGKWGRKEDAKILHHELSARAKRYYIPPMLLAVTACASGYSDEAIQYAREAYAIHDPVLTTAKHYFTGEQLREDPRFNELLAQMRFP